jgi:hypothetical protein
MLFRSTQSHDPTVINFDLRSILGLKPFKITKKEKKVPWLVYLSDFVEAGARRSGRVFPSTQPMPCRFPTWCNRDSGPINADCFSNFHLLSLEIWLLLQLVWWNLMFSLHFFVCPFRSFRYLCEEARAKDTISFS